MEYKFFMVWRENGSTPRIRHDYKDDATVEAMRLATLHPGEKFYVLESQDLYESQVVKHTQLTVAAPIF